MAQLIFPANPTDGQTYTGDNGVTYVYKSSPGVWGASSDGGGGFLSTEWESYPLPATVLSSLGGVMGREYWCGDVNLTTGVACFIGNDLNVYRSTDLVNWTQVASKGEAVVGSINAKCVCAGNGFWYVYLSGPNGPFTISSSNDGLTWSSAQPPGNNFVNAGLVGADQYTSSGVLWGCGGNNFSTTNEISLYRSDNGGLTWSFVKTAGPTDSRGTNHTLQQFCVSSDGAEPTFHTLIVNSTSTSWIVASTREAAGGWAWSVSSSNRVDTLAPVYFDSGVALYIYGVSQGTTSFKNAFANTSIAGAWDNTNQASTYSPGSLSHYGFADQTFFFSAGGVPTGVRSGVNFNNRPIVYPTVSQNVTAPGPVRPWKGRWMAFSSNVIWEQK